MAAYDTVIVGMGAAGCAAAMALCQHGRRVLGLEAQDRVGGRVHTVSFGEGVVELGAEWIHGERKNAVYELALENKVQLASQDLTLDIFRSDGSKGDMAVINRLVTCALENVDHPPEEPGPLGQFLTKQTTQFIEENYPDLLEDDDFLPQFLQFLELIICNYDPSDSWNDISTHNSYRTTDGDLHLSWHKNGYKTLFEILLNTYDHGVGLENLDLHLKKEVTNIKWSEFGNSEVLVTCEDGSVYRCQNVLVTVSIGVLKAKHQTLFTPPLPPSKVKAIQALTIGVMNKIELLFPSTWWPKEQTAFGFLWKEQDRTDIPENDKWLTKVFGATVPEGCNNVLTLWTSGEAARRIESLSDDTIIRKSMELLRRFMGNSQDIPEPTAMIRSNWHSNPYTYGSYTYDSVTSPESPHARDELAQPLHDAACVPRVLFAGEACHNTHFSTVHGAVTTGWREAIRLLRMKSRL